MFQDDASSADDFLSEFNKFTSSEPLSAGCRKDAPTRHAQDKPPDKLSSIAGSSKAGTPVAGHSAAPSAAIGISAAVSSAAPRDFSADVEALRKQQESQKLQLDDLENYVNQAADASRLDLQDALSKCKAVQSETTAHDGRIGALESLVRDLTTRLDASQAKVDLLETQNLDARLIACEARVDSLETRVVECEKLGTRVEECEKLGSRVVECEKLKDRVDMCERNGVLLDKYVRDLRDYCDVSSAATSDLIVQLRANVDENFKKFGDCTQALKQSFDEMHANVGKYSGQVTACLADAKTTSMKRIGKFGRALGKIRDLHVTLISRASLGPIPGDEEALLKEYDDIIAKEVVVTEPAVPVFTHPSTPGGPPDLTLTRPDPSTPTSPPPPPPPPASTPAGPVGPPAAAPTAAGGSPAATEAGAAGGGHSTPTVVSGVPPSTLGELVRSLERGVAFTTVNGISGVFNDFHLELFGCAYDQDQTEGIMDTISLTPVDFDQAKLSRFLVSIDAERLIPSCLPHPDSQESCEFFLEKLRETARYERLDEDARKVVHQKLWECFLAQFMAFKYDIVADIQAHLVSPDQP